MKILSFDSSAKSASVAVTEDGRLISECYVNAALTHSKTLMLMADNALRQADIKFEEIDALCVNTGPGSFTGIRIGVAAVKGLALARNKPCAGTSTLESIAYNFVDTDCIVCATMDARCNQVYTALFKCEKGIVIRLCDDKAESVNDLYEELLQYDGLIYLAGDGAEICFKAFADRELKNIRLSGESRRFQRAYGVALAADNNKDLYADSSALMPVYLRPPQAERELKLRKGE